MSIMRTLFATSALASVALLANVAHAGDADADRIAKAGHSLKWNWTPPGKSDRYGHAEVLVHASLPAVRAQVQNFGAYRDFAPNKFKTSKVLGREGNQTEVQLVLKVLRGFVSLEPVLRFAPARSENGAEVVEGTLARGNVKAANVVWTMRSVNSEWTVLKCDLLLRPDLPAPQGALDEELRDAAQQAVDKIHDKAQGTRDWVTYTP